MKLIFCSRNMQALRALGYREEGERVKEEETFVPVRNVISFYFFIKLPQKRQTVLS
jgi:hypothetical protein